MASTEQTGGEESAESLHQHHQVLQQVFDAIELPIIRTDRDGQVQGLNRAAAVLAGYPPEACIGKTCDALFNPDRSAGGTGTIRRAVLRAESQVADAVVYSGGREMPIRFGVSPLFDAGGEVDGTVNYLVRDLSEERALLVQIRVLADRLAAGDLGARAGPVEAGTTGVEIIEAINGIVDLLAGQVQALTAQTILSTFYADELAKVNANLKLLAEGSVDLDLSVRTTDQATAMAGMQFVAINKEITRVATSLTWLVNDTGALARAIIHGRFGARADEQVHRGVYRSVIRGVNGTLDTLIGYFALYGPLQQIVSSEPHPRKTGQVFRSGANLDPHRREWLYDRGD